ncbi:MAG: GNAT family N-acetyltransferase [Taibaiella sp.]|nr:GNAT family N-acetyltransferase [Taibaiella sp.]
MNDITIKEILIKEHYSEVADMMRGLHENERNLNSKTALWQEIKDSYMRHVINRQDEYKGVCLVAYKEDVAVGFIFGYAEEPDDSRIEEYTGKELYVSDGFVYPKYRQKGIYKLLNDQLEKNFIEIGVRRISRFTLASNNTMRSLLEKEGYSITRVLYEKWL